MSGHTPGPWQTCNGERGKYRVISVAEPIVSIASTANNARERTLQAEANARLIAAAPELLAACKLALENGDLFAEDAEQVQAAIAKAEGT